MKSSDTETGLLQKALVAFNRETELELTVNAFSESHTEAADAELELRPFGIRYSAEVKRWAQQTNENAIAAQLRRLRTPALLVADYVNPNMADRLRALEAQFIDAAGNAYLKGEGVYIFIRGNRLPLEVASSRKTTRAFNASGLRVIFNFLLDPKLVGATYRAISEVCGVSLGTVGWVLNDLKSLGYIHERSKKQERTLAKPIELLDRWVEAYPEKLTPELEIGFFETPFELPWKELNLSAFDGCWSGEVGASLLDDYLSPAQGTVYLPRQMFKQLAVKYRLRKASEHLQNHSNAIRICEKFWGESMASQGRPPISHAAPDILIYADLLVSGDSRNLEAAERLYERIKTRLGIDGSCPTEHL